MRLELTSSTIYNLAHTFSHGLNISKLHHGRVMTSPIFLHLWKDESALLPTFVDEIINDLEFNYSHSASAFPNHSELENHYQREQRLMMVQEWMNSQNWQATEKQKLNILTTLFYSIWNQRFVNPSTFAKTPPTSHSRSKSNLITPTKLQDYREYSEPEEQTIQYLAQPSQPLGRINHRAILHNMLDKVMELHAPRYSEFLNTRDDWDTLLPSYLRDELWQVCSKEQILLHEYAISGFICN